MNLVLVDTSVWSEALRRNKTLDFRIEKNLKQLIEEGQVSIIGPIRQELLSGIKDEKQFEKIRLAMSAFEDSPIISNDYELAAKLNNQCRKQGIQGSHIDFLICAVAISYSMEIFTLDKDFSNFLKAIKIQLYKIN